MLSLFILCGAYTEARLLILMTASQNIPISVVFQSGRLEVYTVVPRTNAHNISECALWELPADLWAPQRSPLL